MKYNSVLKYPGAKWRIAPWIIDKMPLHHSYVEPFFGSGAVLFSKKPSPIETINDIDEDEDIVNLFSVIRDGGAEDLAQWIYCTPYARAVYDETFNDGGRCCDQVERAGRFLVRHWQGHGFRTGCYKQGWKNDIQGREKAYALTNWCKLPEWIIAMIERLRGVQIENKSAVDVIRRFNHPRVLIYADPPYLLNTRSGKMYKHEMTEQDHEELLQVLLAHSGDALISGYDSELYNDILHDWVRHTVEVRAEGCGLRQEVLWVKPETNERTVRQIRFDELEEKE